jgi:undecaprenyl-phosphate 4-deoxy-4-formamido-L-arabinose transferase
MSDLDVAGVASGISVVVPVYNSAELLSVLHERVTAALADHDFELVLVNDGSVDGSWRQICALAASDPRVRGVDLARNYGQHNALLAGVRAASRELIVTIDDDLQNAPEDIPKLLARLADGFDVVYGTSRGAYEGLARALGTRLTKFALRIAIGGDVARNVSAFRAFRTQIRDAFADFSAPYVSLDALLSWGTSRFAAVPVAVSPRGRGRSGYTLGRLATHALNVLTGFTTRPLRWASALGLAFTLVGAGLLAYVLIRYVIGGTLPGFTFLASAISLFAGVQLLTLGVAGEYLARMHDRVINRPPYAIRDKVGG